MLSHVQILSIIEWIRVLFKRRVMVVDEIVRCLNRPVFPSTLQ